MRDSDWHTVATAALSELDRSGEPIWISRQVLREALVVLTRAAAEGGVLSVADVLAHLRLIEASYTVADDDAATTRRLFDLVEQIPVSGKRIHDANIVATMLAHGIGRLLTHNRADFERFSGIIEVVGIEP